MSHPKGSLTHPGHNAASHAHPVRLSATPTRGAAAESPRLLIHPSARARSKAMGMLPARYGAPRSPNPTRPTAGSRPSTCTGWLRPAAVAAGSQADRHRPPKGLRPTLAWEPMTKWRTSTGPLHEHQRRRMTLETAVGQFVGRVPSHGNGDAACHVRQGKGPGLCRL